MKKSIRLIHLEDLRSDADLIEREMKKGGLVIERLWVTNRQDFEKALAEFEPDIVLCDHSLPTITSVEALQLVKTRGKRLPFILITATVSEEFAVSMMKEGIDDYILKDRIQRLPSAITNVLEKADVEKEKAASYAEVIKKEKRFRALIENIADAIILVDEEGKLLYHSPSVKRITGFDLDELNGRVIFEFFHPEDLIRAISFFKSIRNSLETAIPNEFRMRHKNGSYIWVEGTITNLLQDESVKAYIINYRDVTDRKLSELLLQKSEANLRTIFDNTTVAYVFADFNYRIISFNQQATLRYKKEIHVNICEGDSLLDYLEGEKRQLSKVRFDKVLSGSKIIYETSFPEQDGSLAWYAVNLFPVHDTTNSPLGFVISSEDITRRKTIELERTRMISDLMQHNKDLEQFAYIISHNLRSPVANILGLSNILSRSSGLSDENFKKCLDGLSLSAQKLDEVIIDLNLILQTRRDIGEQKETVSMPGLLNDIKSIIGDLIEKEKISINADFQLTEFFTIKSYLHSIFFNLISNSIKYRRSGVAPQISIRTERSDNNLLIKFNDNGLGIDLSLHGDKLFGLYKKFHSHVDGKGMGLFMVKTQVEILGGTISVESTVNKGTQFLLTFPL